MIMKKNSGFTITELLIVLIVIGVLSTLGITQYGSFRERVLDKEAIATLRLLQQSQRIYRIENTAYFPRDSVAQTDIGQINSFLRLFLNEQAWDYATYSGGAMGAGTSTATRVTGGRTWTLPINANTSTCSGSCL